MRQTSFQSRAEKVNLWNVNDTRTLMRDTEVAEMLVMDYLPFLNSNILALYG